jgi:hypothetical protein
VRCDYNSHFSIDYTSHPCYITSHPRSLRGVSGGDPEGGAGSGVPRRRLATVCPGRPGTPPARHYDLAARSSLHGSARQMPAVAWRRAPKETEARPRGPKPPRWSAERRASRVMGHKAPRKRLAYRVMIRPTGASHAPERLSALRPPLDSGERSKGANPGRKNAPRERGGVVRCQIFYLVVPAEPRQRREPESIVTGSGYGFRVREHAAKLAQAA